MALELEGTAEAPHFDRAAFKVARIYVTLAADGRTANFGFTPDEQELKCLVAPKALRRCRTPGASRADYRQAVRTQRRGLEERARHGMGPCRFEEKCRSKKRAGDDRPGVTAVAAQNEDARSIPGHQMSRMRYRQRAWITAGGWSGTGSP